MGIGSDPQRPSPFQPPYPTIPSSAARKKNLGFHSTSRAGTKVQEPKKLIPIHKARSRPISEQKRMLENAHNIVAVTRVIAVKVTALPEVASPNRTASVTSPLNSSTARLTMYSA